MAVVFAPFVTWDPRVGPIGNDRFRYPDQPLTRAAMEQIIDQVNAFAPGDDDLVLTDPLTRELMTDLKNSTMIIHAFYPFIRTRWHPGTNYEEYVWDIAPNTELLINDSDIFHVRRRSANQYIPFQNQYFVTIARHTLRVAPFTITWEFEQFGYLTVAQTEVEEVNHFGFTEIIRDFRFERIDNQLHTVIDNANEFVEIGVFVGVYQDLLGDYWARNITFDYTVTLVESEDDWTFTFTPIGGPVQIALTWYAPNVGQELPGILNLTEETILTIPKGTIGALKVVGIIGSPKIFNFKLDSTLPMITDISLEGGTVLLGEDGYRALPVEDSTSPHVIVVTFDQTIVEPITIRLHIQGHTVQRRDSLIVTWQNFRRSITLDPSLGDIELTNVGVEWDDNIIRFPFIPLASTGWNLDLGSAGVGPLYRLGPEHMTPSLYSIGAVSDCVGGAAHFAEAVDGAVVNDDFAY